MSSFERKVGGAGRDGFEMFSKGKMLMAAEPEITPESGRKKANDL